MKADNRRAKAGAGSSTAGARVPSSPVPSAPADATETPALVLAAPSRGQGGSDGQPTTRRRDAGATGEESAAAGADESAAEGVSGGTKGSAKRGRGEGYTARGTQSEQGGTPQVRVPTAAEGVQAVAIDTPDISISPNANTKGRLPRIHHNLPPDPTPSSGEYIPFSEDIHAPKTDFPPKNVISLTIEVDPPPEHPEPGTVRTQPKLGREHGRDLDGKVLPHERTDILAEQVARWVACGAGDNEIAAYLGIRVGQLRKFYKHELETGQFKNNMDVAGTILDLAKAGVPQISIFWAKSRMGWRDSDKNDQNNAALLNIHIHT